MVIMIINNDNNNNNHNNNNDNNNNDNDNNNNNNNTVVIIIMTITILAGSLARWLAGAPRISSSCDRRSAASRTLDAASASASTSLASGAELHFILSGLGSIAGGNDKQKDLKDSNKPSSLDCAIVFSPWPPGDGRSEARRGGGARRPETKTVIFVSKTLVLKIQGSRSRTKKTTKSYLRPLGTTYSFKMRPDSRSKYPESQVGKRPKLLAPQRSCKSAASEAAVRRLASEGAGGPEPGPEPWKERDLAADKWGQH